MDAEAEAVTTESPARPLNCVEAEAVAGTAAEDSCDARGSLQPAPAQPPGDPAAQASVSNGEDAGGGAGRELVDLKIIWNKTKHDVKVPLDSTGSELKQKIHSITGLPPAMQKVMYKGLVPEDKTLREIKVTSGAKIMVVGSTINDVLAVNTPKDAAQQDAKAEENKKEPLCRQKQHRKVLDKGKPEDVMPSVKGAQERLPTVPLSGMYNKSGGKVRLTFKLEQDQLWIGTKGTVVLSPPLASQHPACLYTPQPWLLTDLICLPCGAPSSSCFVCSWLFVPASLCACLLVGPISSFFSV